MHPISQAKLDANRANAQLSTGPQTPEGKATVSQNAVTHGLFGQSVPVTDAERPEFEELRLELVDHIRPTGVLEEIEFTNLVHRAWQLRRLTKMEAALFTEAQGQDPLFHPATEKRANLYNRYRRNFENAYRAALKALRDLQTTRGARVILQGEQADCGRLADVTKLMRLRFAIDRDDARKQRELEKFEVLREQIERERAMETLSL